MKKLLAILCVVCLVMSLSVGAFASAEMSMGGGSSAPTSYDAVLDVTEDDTIEGVEMTSENGDENIIHVYEGATVTVTDSTFTSTGNGSGGDDSSFYGVGSVLFVSDGELYAANNTIDTDSAGAAGVFAYDSGVAYVYNCEITTTQTSSGGLHVAGGGTLYAWDCYVVTSASMSSAAIRSDRGGGTMVIDGGTYITEGGTGAVYVTADITINNAYLYTGGSEGVAIEGKNTIRLFDCDLTANMQATELNDNQVWNIIVYQSMSGDADVGTSEFDMIGGSLTCAAGPVIYNTNTSSYITLKGVEIIYGEDTTYFLQVTGNSSSRTWGTTGANGANCVFSAYEQVIEGDVVYDTISTLDFYLLEGSEMTGSITCNDSLNGGYTGDGIANVYVDADSTWTVTADSVITGTLYCEGTIANATIVDADGNVLAGDGEYTVTVGAYETTVDASGAGEIPVWEDYAVENPFVDASASDEAEAETVEVESDEDVPERPADLAEGEEPPGGFGGID